MVVLALDTATPAGSSAVVRDGVILAERDGDARRTHGERLPRELMDALDAAGLSLDDIDAYAVATGPGSFTGLRVGIATIQGLALARGARVTPVSNFDALARATPPSPDRLAIWLDAHRGEVFALLLDRDRRQVLEPPTSLAPAATLDRWAQSLADGGRVRFVGDAVPQYAGLITDRLGERVGVETTVPRLAGVIGQIACGDPSGMVVPHAIVPQYVRRPDAELARERRQREQTP